MTANVHPRQSVGLPVTTISRSFPSHRTVSLHRRALVWSGSFASATFYFSYPSNFSVSAPVSPMTEKLSVLETGAPNADHVRLLFECSFEESFARNCSVG